MADSDHAHGIFHVSSVKLLVATFLALVVLTALTLLLAGKVGPFGFVVAMIIASMKAALVMAFFMHMAWDKPFNVLVFLGSSVFVLLFIGMTLTDTDAYQNQIDEFPREAETTAQ